MKKYYEVFVGKFLELPDGYYEKDQDCSVLVPANKVGDLFDTEGAAVEKALELGIEDFYVIPRYTKN